MNSKSIVFFIDLDNTLLDNDHIKEEIKNSLIKVLGRKEAMHFWDHHDAFRKENQLVDFPKTIHAYCLEAHKNTCELTLNNIFNTIDFTHALYPEVQTTVTYLKTIGKVFLFTEGDPVYQKMKIKKLKLKELFDRIYFFKHKLDHLQEIRKQNNDSLLVFVDDRAETLQKIKASLPNAYAIEICQGHYATVDHKPHENLDKTLNAIQDLLSLKKENL